MSNHKNQLEQLDRTLEEIDAGIAAEEKAKGSGEDREEKLAFDTACIAEIERASKLSGVQYDQQRADIAKRLNIRTKTLDDEVAKLRKVSGGDDQRELFGDVEPWPDPVNGETLLNAIVAHIAKFVSADDAVLQAAALWSVFSWNLEVVSVSPILWITSPEKRCGKTVLLTAVGKLSYRPIQCANISAAALYRSIEKWKPALLIDEADSFLADKDDIRGVLNSGITRDSAIVIRCDGDDNDPAAFFVWCARALCGIGSIANTLEDRSIPLRMHRKLTSEKTENIRRSNPQDWEQFARQIARWSLDNKQAIFEAQPDPIESLHDRANDCWEPLLQIANAIGGDWPQIARKAALTLHDALDESMPAELELLADIREAFDTLQKDRISSNDLLDWLCNDADKPWSTWNRGKPITKRQLASKLKGFDIKPKVIRLDKTHTGRGYEKTSFADAWERYLPPEGDDPSVTASQPSNDAASSDFTSVTSTDSVTDEKSPQPCNGAGCNAVTHIISPTAHELEDLDAGGVDF